jgi:hypothetical protein
MPFDNEVAQLIDDVRMQGRGLCFDEVNCAGASKIAHVSRLNPNGCGDVSATVGARSILPPFGLRTSNF